MVSFEAVARLGFNSTVGFLVAAPVLSCLFIAQGKLPEAFFAPSFVNILESTRHRQASNTFRAAQILRRGLPKSILQSFLFSRCYGSMLPGRSHLHCRVFVRYCMCSTSWLENFGTIPFQDFQQNLCVPSTMSLCGSSHAWSTAAHVKRLSTSVLKTTSLSRP